MTPFSGASEQGKDFLNFSWLFVRHSLRYAAFYRITPCCWDCPDLDLFLTL